MRKKMRKTVLLLAAVCMLLFSAAGAAESMHREIGNDAFDMEVIIGYDGLMTYGKVMPMRVRIRNFGGDFEGVLGMNAYVSTREYDRYEREIAVPAGSEREFILPVTVYSRQEKYTAEIVQDGKVVCAATSKPDRLINPSAMMIGVLSSRPQNLNNMNIDRDNDVLARYELWQTVPLTADSFPEDQAVLRSFGMLVIDDIDPAKLSDRQQETLDAWLKSGRVLIVGGGTNAGRNISFFSRYTGLNLEEITSSDSVVTGLLRLLGRKDSGKKVNTSIAACSGAEPIAKDGEGRGLVWRTQVGAGRIYTAAFETGDIRLNSENMMHFFWQQLLVDQDQSIYSSILYSDTESFSSAAVSGGWSTTVKAKSFLLPGLLIVAGALVLSCVLWMILKKKDKRQGMWMILPGIAVLCVAAVVLLAGSAETNRPLAVVTENLVQDASGTIRNYSAISVAAPEFGRHRYSTNEENLRTMVYDYVDYDEEDEEKRREPDTLRTCYTEGGENAVTVESVSPWDQVNLTADSPARIAGRVDGEVWMEEDGLHGEIVNGTDRTFSAGNVVTTYGYVSVPELKPGEKAEITMIRKTLSDPRSPKYDEGGLYVENPNLYSVINAATGYGEYTPAMGGREEWREKELAASLINNAADLLRRRQGNWSYGAYESAVFMYCAKPAEAEKPLLHVDGEQVEQMATQAMLTAEMAFSAVGRTGVVFRSAGMDMPDRMEIDENLMPTDEVMQNGRQMYYHSLTDIPTFRFRLEGIEGVKVESLQVLMESYYVGQARAYALNKDTKTWEEIQLNADVKDPGRYLDNEGRLLLQFRSDSQEIYAEIPTPLINLEGRMEHAQD